MIKIQFFWNGNLMAFDDGGEQIPELQADGWIGTWLKRAEDLGYDPTKMDISLTNGAKAKPFKTSEGCWNCEIVRG